MNDNHLDIFEEVFNNLSDALLVFDNQLKIIAANSTVYNFIKGDFDHLEGQNLDEINTSTKINQLSINEFLKSVFSEFEINKLNNYTKEVICSHQDGKNIDANISVSIFEKDEKFFIIKLSDISTQKEVEREYIEAKKKAEENDKQKTAFLANMSHEIRTPLNSIMGFSNLLIEDDPDIAERQEFLYLINTAGKSLLQLIDDIIDISKIEAGQIKISRSDIDVNQVLEQLLLSFNNEKGKRNKQHVTLRINKESGNKRLIINNDPLRFRQIMSNLLVNALKFIDQGFIEFGYTEMEPDFIQFYVKDTGIGISREKSHMVFQRFGQLDDTYKRNREGTGLGLAISKQLVELMGGKIWFDSEFGKGTTFYFTLPNLKNHEDSSMPYGTLNNLSFNWSEYVFLIVDDVEANFLYYKSILKNSGALILWAKNGIEAVKMCRNNNAISLVLMDIQMPQLSGYDATIQIRKFAPNLPIIAQTAFADDFGRDKAIEMGCDDYITKPINQIELISLINKVLQ